MLAVKQTQGITDWTQCWFDDSKRTGYIAVTDFRRQYFYGAKDINALIRDTEGQELKFMSLNSFTFGSRKTNDIRQIRNIGIDLDQYKLDLSVEEGLDHLLCLVEDKIIPEPNLVLTSRGIQLFYTIQNGASPDMSWLVSYITDQFISKLKSVGADSNAKDLSRVMRVPNSVNERNGAVVKPDIWNPSPYTLEELQTYCKPLDRFSYKGKKKTAIKRIAPKNLSFFYKTNNARLVDLDKLIEIRNGDFTHKRNIFLYIYAYHQSLICSSLADTEAFIWDVYNRIHSKDRKRMTQAEVQRTVKSAYDDSREFFEFYKANGYKVIYAPNDGIIKPYKTSNLIEILEITPEEQRQLSRIHTGDVSKEKDTERKRKERRAAGVVSREEYEINRNKAVQDKLSILKQLLDKGLTRAEIAKEMGISTDYVKKLKRQL